MPPGAFVHDDRGGARRGTSVERSTSCRSARTSRSGALRVTNERDEQANLSVFSALEFCLWDARDDSTNGQRNFSTGEVEVVDGVIYHKTEYRERRDHFAYFACSEPLAGFDTQREAFLGEYRSWDSPLAVARGESFQLGRPRLGADRLPPRAVWSSRRARRAKCASCSATRRTRSPRSSIHPAHRRSTRSAPKRCSSTGFPRRQSRRAWRRSAPTGRVTRGARSEYPGRRHEPDGQYLEPLPEHGHVQSESVDLIVRVGDGARHGLPRLEPGSPRLPSARSPIARASGSSTSPRHSSRRAAPTTSTSRSPSAATTRSDRASTTTRCGWSLPSAPM